MLESEAVNAGRRLVVALTLAQKMIQGNSAAAELTERLRASLPCHLQAEVPGRKRWRPGMCEDKEFFSPDLCLSNPGSHYQGKKNKPLLGRLWYLASEANSLSQKVTHIKKAFLPQGKTTENDGIL